MDPELIEMELERRLTVLFGSQTGTAEDVAARVGREGRRRRFQTVVAAMDDYDKVGVLFQKRVETGVMYA